MKNSFKRNLIIGFGVSLMLLIISSAASFISINSLLYSSHWVNHTRLVINKLDNILYTIRGAESGQRGFLLTGDERFLDAYHGALEHSNTIIKEVRDLTIDNPVQTQSCDSASVMVAQRFALFDVLIDKKRKNELVTQEMLLEGHAYMDSIQSMVLRMQDREQNLLEERTANLNQFAYYTPILIVIAAVLSIIITLFSFFRGLADYNKLVVMQNSLLEKDEDITRRLNIVQSIADKISSGDYKARISEVAKDDLGSISESLNKMAQSLDYSFSSLSDKEWTQAGIASLNEKMLGEKDVNHLASRVIEFLAEYTHSDIAAFYLNNDHDMMLLAGGIALDSSARKEVLLGEGLVGRSALTGKLVLMEDIQESEVLINYSAGGIRPKTILTVPVFYEEQLKGVVELASRKHYSPVIQDFLKTIAYNIGMALHSARNHQRLEELLAETQAQSEELQAQHSELENVNAELQVQAEKLQTSEEELRVQQEELQQVNQELEERSRMLEERNELIQQRNLEIQRKAEELTLSAKYKSEFLANMSHELRTPLNSILLLSRLLSENHEGNLSADQVEYAKVMQGSGNSLLTLIDEILDLSKIESGKMQLEYEPVSIEDIASEMRSLFAPLAKEKQIDFEVTLAPEVPHVMEADRLRLEQIIRNLISNALKFTTAGSVGLHIRREKDCITFTVKDTGIGIPRDKQQIIFEAFQQADGSTRRKYGGTGLGLSISRELAKLLGGEIRLKSEEGKGSEFTLWIPLEKGAVIRQEEKTQREMKKEEVHEEVIATNDAFYKDRKYSTDVIPASVPDDRNSIADQDKVILIVEDDTAFAKSLLEYTRQKGYKGIVAVRGDEGIDLARRFRPLGILLDIQLPVKNGWEVMEALKSDPVTRPIPVHIMSSYEVKARSISRGAVDFINKPVAFEKMGEMFRKIEDALSRHPKKVMIVEENPKHAQALAYFLESFDVNAEIKSEVGEGIKALQSNGVDCVILDMGIPAQQSYQTLEAVKKTSGLENIPIIIFTGKNLSQVEEQRIRQYADSIVIKTAHSYQRILDEVSLFLHLVEENKGDRSAAVRYKRMGELEEVLKGKTVLIADDDVRNIFSLTKALESYGMTVFSAIDGKEALKQLTENGTVDIVLMDMMMPEMDGYETTRHLRGMPQYKTLPVIAVTAKAMTGDREKCIAAGASDYITKPVDVDQLISLLRVWLYQ